MIRSGENHDLCFRNLLGPAGFYGPMRGDYFVHCVIFFPCVACKPIDKEDSLGILTGKKNKKQQQIRAA